MTSEDVSFLSRYVELRSNPSAFSSEDHQMLFFVISNLLSEWNIVSGILDRTQFTLEDSRIIQRFLDFLEADTIDDLRTLNVDFSGN